MNRAAWSDDPAATNGVGTMSEVAETPPTSFVIVELARPPRQAFRFAGQADALRLAERLRRADPDAAVRTETPEEARAVLLDLAFVPEDAIGPLIIMESWHLDREIVEATSELWTAHDAENGHARSRSRHRGAPSVGGPIGSGADALPALPGETD